MGMSFEADGDAGKSPALPKLCHFVAFFIRGCCVTSAQKPVTLFLRKSPVWNLHPETLKPQNPKTHSECLTVNPALQQYAPSVPMHKLPVMLPGSHVLGALVGMLVTRSDPTARLRPSFALDVSLLRRINATPGRWMGSQYSTRLPGVRGVWAAAGVAVVRRRTRERRVRDWRRRAILQRG